LQTLKKSLKKLWKRRKLYLLLLILRKPQSNFIYFAILFFFFFFFFFFLRAVDDAELAAELARVEEEDRLSSQPIAAIPAGKPHVNVVFIGHVDHGKSTMSGAILLASNMVDKREVQKLQADAEAEGRESWWKAFLMDTNPEERAKGKTQETARSHFETNAKMYTILDAPGHKAFVPSMISGAAQADIAVLVVSARAGEFEDGFIKGGQTKEHTMLVRTMGVSHIVVAINKMDDKTVEWSEKRFNEMVRELSEFLKRAGFKKEQISIVPLSALSGVNLKDRMDPTICSWYSGKSLLETLDDVSESRENDAGAPVRFPVLDRYKEAGKVFVIGKLAGGTIRLGDTLVVVPGEREGIVNGIESEFGSLKEAKAGDNVTLSLKGLDEAYVNSGYVLCAKGQRLCPAVSRFQAQILISNLPDARPIMTSGYQCVLHVHTCTVEVTIEKIVSVLDKKTGKPKKGQAFARKGAAVTVNVTTAFPIAVEKFADFNPLSRILLRDEDQTIAVGKIVALPKQNEK
jgi:peptide chain release factor subunit 3